jgi:hypothetical protein
MSRKSERIDKEYRDKGRPEYNCDLLNTEQYIEHCEKINIKQSGSEPEFKSKLNTKHKVKSNLNFQSSSSSTVTQESILSTPSIPTTSFSSENSDTVTPTVSQSTPPDLNLNSILSSYTPITQFTSNSNNNPILIQVMASKDIKLQKFSGKDTDIPIEKWLKVFDLITITIKDDVDKNIKLISYLEGKAFEYYADHIATDVAKLSYVEVKKLLVDRFCFDLVAPSLLAIERKLKASESVRTYYDEKLALLDRTQMTVKDKIALLTKGLPEEYQKVMISACVEDTNKWLVIASNFEANFGIHKRSQTNSHSHYNSSLKNRNFQKNYYKPNVSQVNNQKSSETNNCTINHCSDKSNWRSPNFKSSASKFSNDTHNDKFKSFRKNSKPKCRICSETGLTEYHFYKECPNLQNSNDKVSDD